MKRLANNDDELYNDLNWLACLDGPQLNIIVFDI